MSVLFSFSKHSTSLINSSLVRFTQAYFIRKDFIPVSHSSSVSHTQEDEKNYPLSHIRNFSIIAHVDHGKSTLADRLLEVTGAIVKSSENKQVLDRLQVEKERGITVKAVAVSLEYNYNGENYLLNLIDTPGHVDFSNEVSRSLSACQGVILLVDANQGVQAQTVANFYLAFTAGLTIIPVLNKIDLKNANPEEVESQLKTLFTLEPDNILRISAKTGLGVEELLRTIIEKIPAPESDRNTYFKALLIDSWFERHRGAVCFVYVTSGKVCVGDEITSYLSKKNYTVKTVSKLKPGEKPVHQLCGGEVGVIHCNMKNASEACVGDTLHKKGIEVDPIPSFSNVKPMVFSGLYPSDQSEFTSLRSAIEKLALNDPAVTVESDSSPALGQGWRLGFLGLLHLEVFSQRLEQEYGAQVILTAPSVTYKLKIIGQKNIRQYGGSELSLSNPALFPDRSIISEISEPFVIATIITPDSYLGPVTGMCLERRGIQQSCSYINNERILLKFLLPLNEIIIDFHDTLKALTSGYASFDYEDYGYQPSDLIKLNILLNNKIVEELSTIVHVSKAKEVGRKMVLKLKEMIPRQMVLIAIQAVIGSKVLARETIKPFRKDVTAKLYGGDVTRRMKLLKQQSEGKKKMRMFANIEIPRSTFIDVLKHNF